MKLDYSVRTKLEAKVAEMRRLRDEADETHREAETLRELAARSNHEADVIEQEICELLKDVAVPAIVVVNGEPYEMTQDSGRLTDFGLSLKNRFSKAKHFAVVT